MVIPVLADGGFKKERGGRAYRGKSHCSQNFPQGFKGTSNHFTAPEQAPGALVYFHEHVPSHDLAGNTTQC